MMYDVCVCVQFLVFKISSLSFFSFFRSFILTSIINTYIHIIVLHACVCCYLCFFLSFFLSFIINKYILLIVLHICVLLLSVLCLCVVCVCVFIRRDTKKFTSPHLNPNLWDPMKNSYLSTHYRNLRRYDV